MGFAPAARDCAALEAASGLEPRMRWMWPRHSWAVRREVWYAGGGGNVVGDEDAIVLLEKPVAGVGLVVGIVQDWGKGSRCRCRLNPVSQCPKEWKWEEA